jgi:hypothetical protein
MDETAVMMEALTSVMEYDRHLVECQAMDEILRADIGWALEQRVSTKHPLCPMAMDQFIVIQDIYAQLYDLSSRIDDLVRWDGTLKEIADLKSQRQLKIEELYSQQRKLIDILIKMKTPVVESGSGKFWVTKNPWTTLLIFLVIAVVADELTR